MTDAELRADADEVTRLLEQRGARREGDELRFRCPKPEHHAHGDAHPSARWHPEKGVWRCDVSGEGGGTLNLRWLLLMQAGTDTVPSGRSRALHRGVQTETVGERAERPARNRQVDDPRCRWSRRGRARQARARPERRSEGATLVSPGRPTPGPTLAI